MPNPVRSLSTSVGDAFVATGLVGDSPVAWFGVSACLYSSAALIALALPAEQAKQGGAPRTLV